MRNDFEDNSKLIEKLIIDMSEQEYSPLDQLWASKIPSNSVNESLDEVIAELTESEDVPVQESDNAKFELLKSCLDLVGVNAKLELN
jgi:replication initiation and membrane attachment protein DnaB